MLNSLSPNIHSMVKC